ncbi:Vitamin B12 transporter BtuB [Thalassocella blandensis]|nr:Vitamin B12 transporter BtuB [Thalassocella blandensis]
MKIIKYLSLLLFIFVPSLCLAQSQEREIVSEEHVKVWGRVTDDKSRQGSPMVELNPNDVTSINAITLEDLVKYVPSLIIRQRYIGDSNGTVGMRGSNMFQTPRTMVFVDGVPVHYHLQTRWSGAPRWSMVAPNEVGKIEVLYGPFSAEYSGNAMAGVINIETIIPQHQQFHAELSSFAQDFEAYGFSDTLPGYRGFVSYGNRWDDVSLYLSYNHLENKSQPQTFRLNSPLITPSTDAVPVRGAVLGRNEYGRQSVYFGDTGVEHTSSDYVKAKFGFTTGNWDSLLNVVYERREVDARAANNYLRDESGQSVWQGEVIQDGVAFEIQPSNFSMALSARESVILGGRLKGELESGWGVEFNASVFENLKDETREWAVNKDDPAFNNVSSLSAFDSLAWKTGEVKARKTWSLQNSTLHFVSGFTHNNYQLEIDLVSGGETKLEAAFTQLGWEGNAWSSTLGVRFERWRSVDGFFSDEEHADRQEHAISPKYSLTYTTEHAHYVRYSYAQAYRFPIVEELFQNQETARQQSIANLDLQAEFGRHHNLTLHHALEQGYMRINLFYETIDDAIDAQSKIIDNVSVRTFLPIDEVETSGIEWAFVQQNVFAFPLDIQANVTYAKSKIIANAGGDQSFVGKDFPRMPRWRANFLATYHIQEKWDIGGGIRYASNSYGDADNADSAHNVFGAMDDYTFVNLKTRYTIKPYLTVSAGIDNLTNSIAYVHHPWPGRTIFLETALNF